MASYLNGVAETQIPDQTGVTPSSFAPGPDPTLSLPTGLQVGPGGTVIVPVNLSDPRPAGSTGMTQAELALTYDPKVFTVTAADVHLGTVPASGSGWTLSTVVDPTTGALAIMLVSQTPITTSTGGSLVTIDFHKVGAVSGTTSIQLVASVNLPGQGMFSTAAFDSSDRFILSPAPTNTATDTGIEGQVGLQGANAKLLSEVVPANSEATDLVTTSTPDTGLVFQFGNAPLVNLATNRNSPQQASDQLFTALAHTGVDGGAEALRIGTLDEGLDMLLVGQMLQSRSPQDDFDSLVWAVSSTESDRQQGMGEALVLGAKDVRNPWTTQSEVAKTAAVAPDWVWVADDAEPVNPE
jgi:hypothetical protein